MTQTMTDDIADFLTELARQEVAEKTIRAYRADLAHLARWFETATGEPFRAAAVTPTDVRDYRAHLVSVERRQPATVNRRLAALPLLPVGEGGRALQRGRHGRGQRRDIRPPVAEEPGEAGRGPAGAHGRALREEA